MTALAEHKAMIITTTSHIRVRLEEIQHTILILLQEADFRTDDAVVRRQLEEQKESMEQCLRICAEASKNVMHRMQGLAISEGIIEDKDIVRQQYGADDNSSGQRPSRAQTSQKVGNIRINIFEDILAAPDARQVIVAAPGESILVARITAKAGATQLIGHMPESTLETLLQDGEIRYTA